MLEIQGAELDEALGNDICQTWVNNNYAMEGIVHEEDGGRHTDQWGIGWVRQFGFNQIDHFPLAGASRDEVLAYPFPDDQQEWLLGLMAPVLERRQDFYIGCDVSPCVFEMYWRLRGMEDSFNDIAADAELVRTMFRRCVDFSVALSEKACARFDLDWLWTGDDVAGQTRMMMSPRTWRELVRPELERVFAVGKAHKLPIAYHSCGAVRPIIGDLVEMGLDVLNPVQCNCPGMDPIELKKEFGARLSFMGGVDTQHLLPGGTAAEVRAATARLLDGMTSDGGGYILAASHSISPETPDENIFAMYEVAGVSREAMFDRAAGIRRRKESAHMASAARRGKMD
jgi:uroporphyrinogen decarboxylase